MKVVILGRSGVSRSLTPKATSLFRTYAWWIPFRSFSFWIWINNPGLVSFSFPSFSFRAFRYRTIPTTCHCTDEPYVITGIYQYRNGRNRSLQWHYWFVNLSNKSLEKPLSEFWEILLAIGRVFYMIIIIICYKIWQSPEIFIW